MTPGFLKVELAAKVTPFRVTIWFESVVNKYKAHHDFPMQSCRYSRFDKGEQLCADQADLGCPQRENVWFSDLTYITEQSAYE